MPKEVNITMWESMDGSIHDNKEIAEKIDATILEKRSNKERLDSLRKSPRDGLFSIIAGEERGDISEDVYEIEVHSPDDISFLKQNGIYVNEQLEFGKVYIYHNVEYLDHTGGGYTEILKENDILEAIDRYEMGAKGLVAKARKSLSEIVERNKNEGISPHSGAV